jgi:hypothetical protein
MLMATTTRCARTRRLLEHTLLANRHKGLAGIDTASLSRVGSVSVRQCHASVGSPVLPSHLRTWHPSFLRLGAPMHQPVRANSGGSKCGGCKPCNSSTAKEKSQTAQAQSTTTSSTTTSCHASASSTDAGHVDAGRDQRVDWGNMSNWKRAGINTSWCLLGCSIGEFGTLAAFGAMGLDQVRPESRPASTRVAPHAWPLAS